MGISLAAAILLCHLCYAATVATSPVGHRAAVVMLDTTTENPERQGSTGEFFRLPGRSGVNTSVSALLGFAIFVFIVAPTVLKLLEKQDKTGDSQE